MDFIKWKMQCGKYILEYVCVISLTYGQENDVNILNTLQALYICGHILRIRKNIEPLVLVTKQRYEYHVFNPQIFPRKSDIKFSRQWMACHIINIQYQININFWHKVSMKFIYFHYSVINSVFYFIFMKLYFR